MMDGDKPCRTSWQNSNGPVGPWRRALGYLQRSRDDEIEVGSCLGTYAITEVRSGLSLGKICNRKKLIGNPLRRIRCHERSTWFMSCGAIQMCPVMADIAVQVRYGGGCGCFCTAGPTTSPPPMNRNSHLLVALHCIRKSAAPYACVACVKYLVITILLYASRV